MRPSMAMTLLLFTFAFKSISFAKTPLEDLCSKLNGSNIDYNTCMARLGSDPRSRSAQDFKELAAIAVDLCVSNATRITARVVEMIANETYAPIKNNLSGCLILYSNVITALWWASDAITAKRYASASHALTNSVGVPSVCDYVFKQCDGRSISPLSKENSDFTIQALLAKAVAEVLDRSS